MEHKARKRFGQNFLHDQAIISQIVHTIAVKKNDHIIEIGPGKGALTRHLLAVCNRLDAIELDRDLIPLLKISLATFSQKLHLINEDVLTVDMCQFQQQSEQATAIEKLRIVGNLPYNISTPVLFHLLKYRQCISDMHFMLQKEVVDRISARPNNKSYGRLSIILQYYFQIEKCFEVSPIAFQPPPKVDSAIVSLRPYDDLNKQHGIVLDDTEALQTICKQVFQQKRKTVRNNLKKIMSVDNIIALGINPSDRAENLTMQDFIKLANKYSQLITPK
jgi:16S rRNA (adenine1518-N6/adenine1519-N6)-dimethyltransferase